ncbi:MAG TPA: hypothetical protein VHB97_07250, partial [Polyangia bacterium]|nr:hypothetical protein [Polyangia bacterium]
MDCRQGRATNRARRWRRLGCLALCLSSLSAPAQATGATARSYLQQGLRLYNDGHYDAAIRELRLGYAL